MSLPVLTDARVDLEFTVSVPLLTCAACGRHFIFYAVFPGHDYEPAQYFPQAAAHYCPYCGAQWRRKDA